MVEYFPGKFWWHLNEDICSGAKTWSALRTARYKHFVHLTNVSLWNVKHFVSLSDVLLWQELNWDLAPITASSWLSIYMQLANVDNMEDTADNFVFPKYSVHEYIQISRVSLSCHVIYPQLGLILPPVSSTHN